MADAVAAPNAVARMLGVLGDEWTLLIVQRALLGSARYGEFAATLPVSHAVLTSRLQTMTAESLLDRRPYQSRPERFEYRFTPKGIDLFNSMIVMMHWGDRWLSGGKPPLLIRHRTCQHDFHAEVVCSECRQPLHAHEVQYFARYALEGVVAERAVPRPEADIDNGQSAD